MASKKTITEVVTVLCEGFGRSPSAATFLAYEFGLEGIADDQVKQAARAALQQSRKFMPTPGELRELASGGSYRDRAETAWLEFDRKSGRVKDPISLEVCRSLGGWQRLGAMEKEQYYAFVRRQFVERYEAIVQSPRGENMLGLEAQSEPLFIGEQNGVLQ